MKKSNKEVSKRIENAFYTIYAEYDLKRSKGVVNCGVCKTEMIK